MVVRPHSWAAEVLLLATSGIFDMALALPQVNQQTQNAVLA
jgi:hypothetical protein